MASRRRRAFVSPVRARDGKTKAISFAIERIGTTSKWFDTDTNHREQRGRLLSMVLKEKLMKPMGRCRWPETSLCDETVFRSAGCWANIGSPGCHADSSVESGRTGMDQCRSVRSCQRRQTGAPRAGGGVVRAGRVPEGDGRQAAGLAHWRGLQGSGRSNRLRVQASLAPLKQVK